MDENADVDKIIDVLKLIVARSPRAAETAVRALFAARNNSPVFQARYSQVIIMALADPEATFTPDERAIIADGLTAGSRSSGALRQETRNQQLNAIAQGIGYDTWAKLETAALHGEIKITRVE